MWGELEITSDVDHFACGYCGAEQIVKRGGGMGGASIAVTQDGAHCILSASEVMRAAQICGIISIPQSNAPSWSMTSASQPQDGQIADRGGLLIMNA